MNTNDHNSLYEFFQMRSILKVGVLPQVAIITILYVLTTLGYYFQVNATGKMDGYTPGVSILFVPIYEEMIFRGILLKFFLERYQAVLTIVIVSALFSLWHLKNIFWLSQDQLLNQMLYTGIVFSPIACWVTIKTKTIWPVVILHYLHNFPYNGWSEIYKGLSQ